MNQQSQSADRVTAVEGSLDRSVRPIVVNLDRLLVLMSESRAGFHSRLAGRMRQEGVPLGVMLWLADANSMTPEEIENEWRKELSKHGFRKVIVDHTPDMETKIILLPNVRDHRHLPVARSVPGA